MRRVAKRKASGRKGVALERQDDEVTADSLAQEEIVGGKHDERAEDVSPSPGRREKKARATTTEYLEEKRNLQDLWKAAFPVGTQWHEFDAVYEFNWDFKHLEEALEEGGMLYGKRVFVFGVSELGFYLYKGAQKYVHVPTVIVIESPFPPSDKLAITSIQSAKQEIVPMKQMKMDWVPYIPFDKRDRQVDRMNFQIFSLSCTQRRSTLRHLKEDRVRMFGYCLPYFYQPFREDEQSTEVNIIFPSDPPIVSNFDLENDTLQGFVDEMIEDGQVSEGQMDEYKEFVKERVRAAKRANREAREARMKAIEEMSEETRQAFQSIKFYKFYPRPSQDISRILKTPFINRYYGNAHQVL